jgi:hypothetical protein
MEKAVARMEKLQQKSVGFLGLGFVVFGGGIEGVWN